MKHKKNELSKLRSLGNIFEPLFEDDDYEEDKLKTIDTTLRSENKTLSEENKRLSKEWGKTNDRLQLLGLYLFFSLGAFVPMILGSKTLTLETLERWSILLCFIYPIPLYWGWCIYTNLFSKNKS